MKRMSGSRVVAVTLVVALAVVFNPAWASTQQAGLVGRVLADDARTPFPGAVLQLTGPSDRVIKSEPTGSNGEFALTDLTPGTYRCVVATEEGLYQITTALTLEAGQTRTIQLALKKESPVAAGVGTAKGGGGAIGQGAQAALIGFGVIVGTLVLAEALESDPKTFVPPSESSPTQPGD
jgi:hypothetical protein